MQLSSIWPPRRTVDRLAAEAYRRRHLDAPWLTRPAIALLPDLLRATDRCLEYGAGTSTAWLTRRVGSVVSAEHDPVWFARVQRQLAQEGLDRDSVRLLGTDPQDQPESSPYVRVIDEFGDGELDACFVDGMHRATCALAAIPKLASGGLLLVDDAQGYLDHPTRSPHSRAGCGPLDGAGPGSPISSAVGG